MWGAIFSAVANIVATLLGQRRDTLSRKNSPEIIAAEKAKDEVKSQDEINLNVAKAQAGDGKALEDLRKGAAE
jgi:hypothetical protein